MSLIDGLLFGSGFLIAVVIFRAVLHLNLIG